MIALLRTMVGLISAILVSSAFAAPGLTSVTQVSSSPAFDSTGGAFRVKSSFSPTSGTIGDRFQMHLIIEAPDLQNVSVKDSLTKAGDQSGSWTLVSKSEPSDSDNGKGLHTRSLEYVVTAFDVGETTSPQIAVSYSPPNNLPQTIKFTDPVMVHINSVLSKNIHDLQGAKPPVALPVPTSLKITGFTIALLILALLAYLLWRRFGRHFSKLMSGGMTPEETALLELERLEKERLIDQKKFREFYTRLSDTVRSYVGDAMGVKSRDLTSYELLLSLSQKADEQPVGSAHSYKEMLDRLDGLLDEADLVKFARAVPDTARCRTSLNRGREIVDLLKYRFEPEKKDDTGSGALKGGSSDV